jgi:phosphoserine phosphatase
MFHVKQRRLASAKPGTASLGPHDATAHLHLDGTLLHATAAPVKISRQLGLDPEITELERDFIVRQNDSWALICAERPCPVGRAHRNHVAAAFEGVPWLRRIRDTWAEIRE